MKQKKMALINDITGFGRCSIAVMAPIISVMKIQSVVIPTAILSTHTQFPIYHFDDYTSHMSDYIQTYKDLHLDFDGISTGFLGSIQQVEIVIDFIKTFKKDETFVLVDPVMGDYGKIYQTYTKDMCEKMKELVPYADILTPNLTEVCTLLDIPYPDVVPSVEQLESMAKALADKGPKRIVITGLALSDDKIMNFVYDDGVTQSIIVDRVGGDRSGTGDVVASVIAGSYMNGMNFVDCVSKAVHFASKCIEHCEKLHLPNYYGLCFEEYLSELGE